VSVAIFGGTAPLVATLLIKITGDNQAPAFYLIGASLLILVVPGCPRPTAPTSADRRRRRCPCAQVGECPVSGRALAGASLVRVSSRARGAAPSA
jgi:hypothetical protein